MRKTSPERRAPPELFSARRSHLRSVLTLTPEDHRRIAARLVRDKPNDPAPGPAGGQTTYVRQQGWCAVAQHLGQWISKSSWLGEPENVSLGHGVSLLSVEKWGRRIPARYAALPLHAVTNFRP